MKPIILLYNVKEEKYNRMKPVLGLMGIKVKLVDNGSLGDKVEYIAWPEEYANEKEPAVLYSNDIDFEFMILCGLSKSDLDKVLNFMKKNKISLFVAIAFIIFVIALFTVKIIHNFAEICFNKRSIFIFTYRY